MKIYCDYPTPWQATFQDPATPYMEGLINLHHDIMFILFILSGLVFWMLFKTLYAFDHTKNPVPSKVVHASTLEIVWTILPSLVLVVIAFPSFTFDCANLQYLFPNKSLNEIDDTPRSSLS